MGSLLVIPEVGANLLILDGTPYILLHFRILPQNLDIFYV